MKRSPRHSTHISLLILLALSALGFNACFKDPTTIGPGVPESRPVSMCLDSLDINMLENDDIASGAVQHHSFVLSNRAQFGGTADSSYVTIDTSKDVPLISARLYLTPTFQNEAEARSYKLRQVIIELDSVPVLGDDWWWMNRGQVSFVVMTNTHPTPQFERVRVVQSTPPPYTKDSPYAEGLCWKVTNRHEIVMQMVMQTIYTVMDDNRQNQERARAAAVFRLHY